MRMNNREETQAHYKGEREPIQICAWYIYKRLYFVEKIDGIHRQKKDLLMKFIDLEKSYDSVKKHPLEVIEKEKNLYLS